MNQKMTVEEDSVYRHFKGKYYLVLGRARSTDGGSDIICYRPLYGVTYGQKHDIFYRTVEDFFSMIDRPELPRPVSRFEPVTNIFELNRAFKSDFGRSICDTPNLDHPVGRQILCMAPCVIDSVFNDLRDGLKSRFRAESACEPSVYLTTIAELVAWHGASHTFTSENQLILIQAVLNCISPNVTGEVLRLETMIGLKDRRRIKRNEHRGSDTDEQKVQPKQLYFVNVPQPCIK